MRTLALLFPLSLFMAPGCGGDLPSVPPMEGAPLEISVDFGKPLRPVNPLAFGTAEEAYGGDYTGDLDTDPVHYSRLAALNIDQMRFNLMVADPRNPAGPFVCAAMGCRGYEGDVSADGYIQKIKQAGIRPIATVMLVPGELSLSVTVAANAVKHFREIGAPILRWSIDNEPDLDSHGGVGTSTSKMTPAEYSQYYNAVYDAMKAVDPSIQIGGPATSWLDEPFFRDFFARSADKVDFIDFHWYADWRSSRAEEQLLAETPEYAARIHRARALFREAAPGRADTIDIQYGEWNFDSEPPPGDPRAFSGVTAVWGASVLGHILQAGGLSVSFANKDGELGLLFMDTEYGGQANAPMPLYHATGMYTGEGLFRGFGTVVVEASSSVPEVEVVASDHAKSVVIINKSSTRYAARVSLSGRPEGTVELWAFGKEHPLNPAPTKVGALPLTRGAFSVSLAPYSVTTAVVEP